MSIIQNGKKISLQSDMIYKPESEHNGTLLKVHEGCLTTGYSRIVTLDNCVQSKGNELDFYPYSRFSSIPLDRMIDSEVKEGRAVFTIPTISPDIVFSRPTKHLFGGSGTSYEREWSKGLEYVHNMQFAGVMVRAPGGQSDYPGKTGYIDNVMKGMLVKEGYVTLSKTGVYVTSIGTHTSVQFPYVGMPLRLCKHGFSEYTIDYYDKIGQKQDKNVTQQYVEVNPYYCTTVGSLVFADIYTGQIFVGMDVYTTDIVCAKYYSLRGFSLGAFGGGGWSCIGEVVSKNADDKTVTIHVHNAEPDIYRIQPIGFGPLLGNSHSLQKLIDVTLYWEDKAVGKVRWVSKATITDLRMDYPDAIWLAYIDTAKFGYETDFKGVALLKENNYESSGVFTVSAGYTGSFYYDVILTMLNPNSGYYNTTQCGWSVNITE